MKTYKLLIAAVLGMAWVSCEDISYATPGNQIPKVTTLPATNIKACSAFLHGEAHCEDFESDYYRFFLLSEDENLSEYESMIISGGRESVGFGKYSRLVNALKPGTTYYYTMCASGGAPHYYDNLDGRLVKGEVQSFTTRSFEAVAVDLGLSVKWASCNVGAEYPEEYGGYYAWGETEVKNDYSWSAYKWCNGSSSTMTKYCTNSNYGTVDNHTVLAPEDDVAHVVWGDSWRMPTKSELSELCTKCIWTWIRFNGVNGYEIVGPNGNSIFLPAASYCYGMYVTSGSRGDYLSSTLDDYRSDYAFCLYFYHGGNKYTMGATCERCRGCTVRPVKD